MKHFAEIATAQLDLGFVRRNGETVLERRLFSYPFVLARTFRNRSSAVSLHGEPTSSLQVLVQNSGGPIHDGDHLMTRLHLQEGAAAQVTYQGATAIHRARPGQMSREQLEVILSPGSRLAYLPEPRILFPDAAHQQVSTISLAAGSAMLFTDAFTLHDPAAQGGLFGHFHNSLTIQRDGETLLLDRQLVPPNPLMFQHYRAFGTIYLLGLPAPALPHVPGLYAASSQLPSSLGWCIRLAAPDPRPIRTVLAAVKAGTS